MFVLAITRYYLLRGATRRVRQALVRPSRRASVLASALSVVVLGDESGYTDRRSPEDEARGDRRRCGIPSRPPAVVHGVRRSRPGDARRHALRDPDPVGARPRSPRARSTRRSIGIKELVEQARGTHPQRHAGVRRAAANLRRRSRRRSPPGGPSPRRSADLGYALLLRSIRRTIRRTRRRRRSRGGLATRSRTSRRSSGRSA